MLVHSSKWTIGNRREIQWIIIKGKLSSGTAKLVEHEGAVKPGTEKPITRDWYEVEFKPSKKTTVPYHKEQLSLLV
ncbi:hypothetical protein CUU64_15120 [Bacillus sp. V5-8f]|nr:hypothetical protein CUU64_15120 [Bacillus sp. V5-8f]